MKRLTKPTLAISFALVLLGCSKNNSRTSTSYIDEASQPGGVVFIVQNSCRTSCGCKGCFHSPNFLRSETIVSAGSLYTAIT